MLKYSSKWLFGKDIEWEAMPLPIHRIEKTAVNDVLIK